MQVQVNIGFEQLLEIIKDLPDAQLKKLKSAIDTKTAETQSIDLETLLLNGPVATQDELDTIANNREAVNQWRTENNPTRH